MRKSSEKFTVQSEFFVVKYECTVLLVNFITVVKHLYTEYC
jgi:hypothetical protein